LLSDTHTTRGTKEDQPLYHGRLDKVIAAVNAAKVDFVLIAGDLTQSGKPEEIADFKEQVKGFQAPVAWVPGNHDIGAKRIPDKAPGPTAARVENFERELGPSFWAREFAGVRVVGLNSQLFGSGLAREEEMWSLLDNEMAMPSAKRTIVFMHMPPFVTSVDEPGGGYWNIEPAPRAHLLGVLKRGGVQTVLTGHLHYQLVNRHNGILIVTTPPVSFGLPRGVAPQGWTLVTIPRDGETQFDFRPVRD
jgi:alkaline phosphatase D